MKIKFRGSLKSNNLVAYITLNKADLKKWIFAKLLCFLKA